MLFYLPVFMSVLGINNVTYSSYLGCILPIYTYKKIKTVFPTVKHR